jgi:hypothetical protein
VKKTLDKKCTIAGTIRTYFIGYDQSSEEQLEGRRSRLQSALRSSGRVQRAGMRNTSDVVESQYQDLLRKQSSREELLDLIEKSIRRGNTTKALRSCWAKKRADGRETLLGHLAAMHFVFAPIALTT